MAKKPVQHASNGFKPKSWVKYELDKKEIALVKAWTPTFEEMDATLVDGLCDEYRVNLSQEPGKTTWLAVMQTKSDDHQHSEALLSGRGSTPLKALKQLMYKHLELFRKKWPAVPDYQSGAPIDD